MKEVKIGLVFGGKSAEHEISLLSARAIYEHLDRDRFAPILFYINRAGDWAFTTKDDFNEVSYSNEEFYSFLPWELHRVLKESADIYFPILHGPFGEDGRIQSLFELAGKPFVGAGSFASALAMDKITSKILFQSAGLKVTDYLYFSFEDQSIIQSMVDTKLKYPVFVKPCSLGSSVGISKVKIASALKAAVEIAFTYDQKILIENGLDIREIEISIMGSKEPRVSLPGELIPHEEFYDYKDKYLLNQTRFQIPAQLNDRLLESLRSIALKAYRSLYLNGMARVDLFLEKGSNEIFVNEINTIPGFTTISMFPKLWENQGIGFAELVSNLIDYGFEDHKRLHMRVDHNENSGH